MWEISMYLKSATVLALIALTTALTTAGCDRDNGTREERSARPVRDAAPPPDRIDAPPQPERALPPASQEPVKTECTTQNATSQCTGNQFCLFPLGSCGEGTAMGSCTSKPTACSEVNEPVCGCDTKTYGNECKAWLAGVSIKARGECKGAGGNDNENKNENTGG